MGVLHCANVFIIIEKPSIDVPAPGKDSARRAQNKRKALVFFCYAELPPILAKQK